MSQIRRLNKKKFAFLMFLIPTIVVVLLIPYLAYAQAAGDAVVSLLAAILIPVISFLGKLVTVVIRLLISIAQYNDFINSAAVSKGWIIMRDIFNMVFIIILLVIAFATVLGIEKYSYKRLLGGFLLAAILVNFSKLICGIIIDFAQVLMLTFVNAFKEVGEGNIANMLGLTDLMNLDPEVGPVATAKEKISTLFLGIIMMIVALVVVTIIMMILLFRIIILWFLVLLSPIAFMATVLPAFQKYGRQWWDKFISQVIIGPVLAFFLWLSFSIVQDTSSLEGGGLYQTVAPPGSGGAENLLKDTDLRASVSESGKPQNVLNFVIGIGMLIGSLMVAQQMGVAGGKMAGEVVGKMQAVAKGAGKLGLKGIDRVFEKTGKAAVRGLGHMTGAKGLQRFQGFSYDIAKDALRQRKEEKARQRRGMLEGAAAPIAQGLDTVLDPGIWAKKVGDFFHGSKEKIREATEEKDNIDVEIEEINVEVDLETTILGDLNQEKQEKAGLAAQLHSGPMPVVQPSMKAEEKEKIETLNKNMKNAVEEAKKETGIEYDIKKERGRKGLENFLKKRAIDINDNLIVDSEKKIADLQAKRSPLMEQSKAQANIISTERYRPGAFGLTERDRLPLAEIEARKRQAEKTKDVMLTTNGEEALLIEELKKSISQNDGDRAIASLELLTKVNGHNTMMLDHSIQDQVRKLIGEKYTKTDAQGNNLAVEDFNKNPVNLPAISLFYEHITKKIARLNDYESARAVSRIGSIGGLAGNYAMPGMAYIDPLTGLPKFGGVVQKTEKEGGGLDMDKQWAEITRYKANQIEPQTFWKMAHSSTFATEDREGAGGHLHAGGRAYLSNLSGKDIAQMIRMRDDTLSRLNKPEIIIDIRNFAEDISKGLIKGVSKQQAVLVSTFADKLISLKTEPIIKK